MIYTYYVYVTLVAGGGQYGGFDALDFRKIRHGSAGRLGKYKILSVLLNKFARFLFKFHGHRFKSLDLPFLPVLLLVVIPLKYNFFITPLYGLSVFITINLIRCYLKLHIQNKSQALL